MTFAERILNERLEGLSAAFSRGLYDQPMMAESAGQVGAYRLGQLCRRQGAGDLALAAYRHGLGLGEAAAYEGTLPRTTKQAVYDSARISRLEETLAVGPRPVGMAPELGMGYSPDPLAVEVAQLKERLATMHADRDDWLQRATRLETELARAEEQREAALVDAKSQNAARARHREERDEARARLCDLARRAGTHDHTGTRHAALAYYRWVIAQLGFSGPAVDARLRELAEKGWR